MIKPVVIGLLRAADVNNGTPITISDRISEGSRGLMDRASDL